jgi:hypothetical protein
MYDGITVDVYHLHFFIISFFATHMRALFPYMNSGIVKSRQTSYIIPIATKTFLLPLAFSHSGENSEKLDHEQYLFSVSPSGKYRAWKEESVLFEKFIVIKASPANSL